MLQQLACLILSLMWLGSLNAQPIGVKGRVEDAHTGEALPAVKVTIGLQETITGSDGTFVLTGIPSGEVLIEFTAAGYTPFSLVFNTALSDDAGIIRLYAAVAADVLALGFGEVSPDGLDSEEDSRGQNISGLLSSSRDVFVSTAAFTFGPAFFRMRGYDGDLNSTYIGNAPISDAETGRTIWALWGGLNDVTRNQVEVTGISPTEFSFGNLGNTTNIIVRASQQRKRTRFAYSSTNRTYTNRFMLTHSTGMMPNNWAFSFSGSRRWGNEGFVEGTFFDAWAWFASIERKINNRHSLALTTLASPVRRGMQFGAVQEIYNLLGNNHYNPNWGYQNGERRNARVRTMNQPLTILNHFWNPNERTRITNTVSYLFGRTGTTALNWYRSADPRPDYYRYLPSWASNLGLSDTIAQLVAQNWINDPNTRQINWDRLYQINYSANVIGQQARYIVEERRNDQNQLSFTSVINHEISANINLNAGVELSGFKGHYFKTIEDLLGAEFWVDIDQFAERDFRDSIILQNDLNNPNRVVREGDTFGYDYNLHQRFGNIWAMASHSNPWLDWYVAGQFSTTTFWREGFMRNGRFPDHSYGESDRHIFYNYGFKGGATWKITGRHFLEGNLAYMTRAPYMRNVFMSPRTRHHVVPEMQSEQVFSGELSYHWRSPLVRARLTAYHTDFRNQNEINSFYHDYFQTFVNHAMQGINRVHQGFELGAEVNITSALSAQAVANLGNYRYTSRPFATISYDNGSKPDTTSLIYSKYFFVPGTPQTAMSVGLRYSGPQFLFININLNYFDDIYLDFNPEIRTSAFVNNIPGIHPGDPIIGELTKQQRGTGGFTLDASVGKSWRVLRNYFVNLNFSVSNILNNTGIVTGGFEQSRFTPNSRENLFHPRRFHLFGTTYFLNLAIRY